MIRFNRSSKPVTSEDIADTERTLGISFPDDFRAHFLRYNGGRPERTLFRKDGVIFVVSFFFAIKNPGANSFERVFHDLMGILPDELIPFADDPGGDFYCFSKRKTDPGSIWIYRGEYADEPVRASTFLARSLSEFLSSLGTDHHDCDT